jgi:hypothetical protein
MPVGASVEEATLEREFLLRMRGWRRIKTRGADVSRARNILASRALKETSDEWWLWIDSDMVWDPGAPEALLETAKGMSADVVSAAYVYRWLGGKLCFRPLEDFPPEKEILLGPGGDCFRAKDFGLGFCVTRRTIFEKLATGPEVALGENGEKGWPFFMPGVWDDPGVGLRYHPEDTAFCRRASDAGGVLVVDCRPHVRHIGKVALGWEQLSGSSPENSVGGSP